MQPQYMTASGTASSIKMIDSWANPVNIGVALVFSGSVTASFQYTFDDVGSAYPNPSTSAITWWTLISNATGNTTGSITFPVAGVRLLGAGGTGTVTASVVQSGGRGP